MLISNWEYLEKSREACARKADPPVPTTAAEAKALRDKFLGNQASMAAEQEFEELNHGLDCVIECIRRYGEYAATWLIVHDRNYDRNLANLFRRHSDMDSLLAALGYEVAYQQSETPDGTSWKRVVTAP